MPMTVESAYASVERRVETIKALKQMADTSLAMVPGAFKCQLFDDERTPELFCQHITLLVELIDDEPIREMFRHEQEGGERKESQYLLPGLKQELVVMARAMGKYGQGLIRQIEGSPPTSGEEDGEDGAQEDTDSE